MEKTSKECVKFRKREGYRDTMYDSLATAQDLISLFETLNRYKDKNEKYPVFTIVSLVANPDFNKIKAAEYERYYSDLFINKLARTPLEDVWSFLRQGKIEVLFYPEFHGREHLHVPVWLRALQLGDEETLFAFDEGCCGFKNNHPVGIK